MDQLLILSPKSIMAITKLLKAGNHLQVLKNLVNFSIKIKKMNSVMIKIISCI